MKMTLFTADCKGNAANCVYPNKAVVTNAEELSEAVSVDHVCAEYTDSYRSSGNFIRSDVIVMDVDNDHSEKPSDWVTEDTMEDLFADVEFMTAPSRHHLLEKEGKSARPRFHV